MPDSEDGAEKPRRVWPYAKEFRQVLREGHHRQAPACGSPTLVMHWAIWPRHAFGDPLDGVLPPAARGASNDGATQRSIAYDLDNERFFQEVSDFAVRLQERGRVADARSLTLEKAELPDFRRGHGKKTDTHSFKICNPQALAFTLWWSNDAGPGKPNARPLRPHAPKDTDLRVRAHVQTHRDHATVSFFIDVGKSYGEKQKVDAAEFLRTGVDSRRRRIMEHIGTVRRVSGEQIRRGYVELNRLPEHGVADDTKQLLAAADYLYDGVWSEFMQAFEIDSLHAQADDNDATLGLYGQRFAEFRGLVMSIRGLDTDGEDKRKEKQSEIRAKNAPERAQDVIAYTDRAPPQDVPSYESGTIGFGSLTKFDAESNEANTVLKSLWPFMRRMAPWADDRNWVGCGIIGGRALYITPLGSEPSTDQPNEEAPEDIESEPQHLPSGAVALRPHPLRYLIVTKGEPHREQLGRYVERINAIGTMRLFAMRNMASIRNASIHVEVLARMLDGVLQEWEAERKKIDDYFRGARKEAESNVRGEKRFRKRIQDRLRKLFQAPDESRRTFIENLEVSLHPDVQEVEAEHTNALNDLIRRIEGRLIQIAGRLDSIGEGGSGRMLYVARRANYFAGEFMRLYPTLAIVDVEGWINYRNFVERGMQPAFEFITATESRLRLIRERIQIVTDTIQTSALIVETAATRENTETLKRIASFSPWLKVAAGAVAFWAAIEAFLKIVRDFIGDWLWAIILGAIQWFAAMLGGPGGAAG